MKPKPMAIRKNNQAACLARVITFGSSTGRLKLAGVIAAFTAFR